jgi:hypothetical protein
VSSAKGSKPRRDFIGQLAGGAAAMAGLSLAPFATAQAAAVGNPALASGEWDDSWTQKLQGKKLLTVFDSVEFNSGLALHQANAVMKNYTEVVGVPEKDLGLVVVIRHRSIPMAFNDRMWEKYDAGADLKLDDPTTGTPAKRNPFLHLLKTDTHGLVDDQTSLESLYNRGVIFLGCNRATMGMASRLAKKSGAKMEDVHAELKANLIPGMTLLPTGIFAVVRAQNVGCSYMPAWYKID